METRIELGPQRGVLDAIEERLVDVHHRHDKKVSVVGWSLGGIYARHLARLHPDAVRQVITLGSPFRFRPGDRGRASALFERLNGRRPIVPGMELPEEERPPLTVPSTAIYSRTDGIVRYHQCIESADPMRESIEVRGSHSGLGHNPATLYAIADRLAQPENQCRPFRPALGVRRWFPAATTWRVTAGSA